jgi:colanic acid biosynthesis glycosyl transferase WcaI
MMEDNASLPTSEYEQMTSIPEKPRSKVLFVNRYFHPDQSATSQLLFDLSAGLVKAGFNVHVICSRQRYDQPRANLKPHDSVAGVTIHRIWTTRFGRGNLLGRMIDYATFYLSSGSMLLHSLRRDDIVVAKTDPPLISIVCMVVCKLKAAHLVNWLQDIFPEVATRLGASRLPEWLDSRLRVLRNASLRSARMNVVLGGRMQEFVVQSGIHQAQTAIIENWADEAGDARPVEASELRSRLGLAGKFVVGYSGNLGRAHEFQTLLEAASLLSEQRDVAFLMIGGGVGMTMLEAAVASRAMANFQFLPYQPRGSLPDSLAAADVHLVSLRPQLEGLIVPSKFYGILAAGRPVLFVGDRDGELARVIDAADVGRVVEIGKGAELAACIVHLKLDPVRREACGAAAHQFYLDHYTAQRALSRWIDILEQLPKSAHLRRATPAHDVLSQGPSSR